MQFKSPDSQKSIRAFTPPPPPRHPRPGTHPPPKHPQFSPKNHLDKSRTVFLVSKARIQTPVYREFRKPGFYPMANFVTGVLDTWLPAAVWRAPGPPPAARVICAAIQKPGFKSPAGLLAGLLESGGCLLDLVARKKICRWVFSLLQSVRDVRIHIFRQRRRRR